MPDRDAILEAEYQARLCLTCDRCGKAIAPEDEATSEDFCGKCRELAESAAEEDRANDAAARGECLNL